MNDMFEDIESAAEPVNPTRFKRFSIFIFLFRKVVALLFSMVSKIIVMLFVDLSKLLFAKLKIAYLKITNKFIS